MGFRGGACASLGVSLKGPLGSLETLGGPLGHHWRSMAGAWGAWGCFAGSMGGPLEVSGGPLGNFEIIEKPLVFIAF